MKVRYSAFAGVAVAALVVAGLVSPAQAADESVGPGWSGFYFGVTGGYALGEANIDADLLSDSANSLSQVVSEDGKADLEGGMVGGLVGYDHDLGNGIVIGIVGDVSWSGLGGGVDVKPSVTGVSGSDYDMNTDLSWFGTVRGRLGYDLGDAMIYATGGLAMGGVEADLKEDIVGHLSSDSGVQVGWTVGGGINYMATEHLMLGVEYLYVDLGSASYDFGSYGDADTDVNMSIVRGSLSFRF
jgi:outer membrane immunogenic protein